MGQRRFPWFTTRVFLITQATVKVACYFFLSPNYYTDPPRISSSYLKPLQVVRNGQEFRASCPVEGSSHVDWFKVCSFYFLSFFLYIFFLYHVLNQVSCFVFLFLFSSFFSLSLLCDKLYTLYPLSF